jgi:hypothetical protein
MSISTFFQGFLKSKHVQCLQLMIHLYTMTLLVCVEESLCHKVFAANCTVVWSLTRMIAFVNSECRELGERLSTLVARVWPFPSMRTFVNTEVVQFSKCLATYITDVWFLSCVGAPVCNE